MVAVCCCIRSRLGRVMSRTIQIATCISVASFGLSSATIVVAHGNDATSEQVTPQPPRELHVSDMHDRRVTFRWTPPDSGAPPTAFIVEGGATPGAAQVIIVTEPVPILSVEAPTGAFFVRVRTQSTTQISEPSNEIQVFVEVPSSLAPPETLVALVNGSSVTLAWQNSFRGGVPTSLLLDLPGLGSASLPVSETLSVHGVPAGTYTASLRGVNSVGSSPPSNTVSLTVPASCSGVPLPPTGFLANTLGATIFAIWEPPARGTAPTGYVVNVRGSFVGSFMTTERQLSHAAAPGTYTINVMATNPCGSSDPTPSQTVTLPRAGPLPGPDPAAPEILPVDREHLERVRASLQRGETQYRGALAALEADAARALNVEPVSVMDKPITPPSGDKHDYLSQAPYWWPDPSRPNGTPYIRRDGERNPEIDRIRDRANLGRLANILPTLALAYFFTEREAYAQHAAQLVRVWFIDPSTRMNPHLRFAQFVPGVADGRAAGIIETRLLPNILGSVETIRHSPAWTNADDRALNRWMLDFVTWLRESPQGRSQTGRSNNQETWYYVQIVELALFTDQPQFARETLEQARAEIGRQFEPDGRQPRELERTRAWDYSIFNLSAFMRLAVLGEAVGVDFWNFRSGNGASLRRGIDFLIPFATGEKNFPYKQITDFDPTELHPILRRAAIGFNEPRYREIAEQIGGGTRRLELTLP